MISRQADLYAALNKKLDLLWHQVYIDSRYLLDCSAWCNATIRYYCPPSFSVCEQAEKLEVLDHAFSVTSMAASIGQ